MSTEAWSRAKSANAWLARLSAAVTQRSCCVLALQAVVWLPNFVIDTLSLLNAELVWLSASARFAVLVLALLTAVTTITA